MEQIIAIYTTRSVSSLTLFYVILIKILENTYREIHFSGYKSAVLQKPNPFAGSYVIFLYYYSPDIWENLQNVDFPYLLSKIQHQFWNSKNSKFSKSLSQKLLPKLVCNSYKQYVHKTYFLSEKCYGLD